MAKAELETKLNDASVDDFIEKLPDEQQRTDTRKLVKIFEKVTGEEPRMWGSAIIGFGLTHLKYASGRELDSPLAAFSPRKGKVSLYITGGVERYEENLADLGNFQTGKGCLYIKRLSDVDEKVLVNLIKDSVRNSKSGVMYPRHE